MGPSNPRGMKLGLFLRASLLAVAVLGWAATPALAAPQVISQDPEPGTQFHEDAPERVTMSFSEPLDDSSKITVVDECGGRVDDGEVTVGGTTQNELSVGIAKTVQSTYTVEYAATGVTGTATGSYEFVVHGGSPCAGGGGSGGGGHGGHGGGGDGGGSGGHDGHGGGSGGSGGHDGHAGGGDDDGDHDGSHSGMGDDVDHSQMSAEEHAEMSGDHDGHKNKKKGKHDKGHGNGHDEGHGNDHGTDGQPPFAAGDDQLPTDIPTGTTVAISLGLALALGGLGGWVLRVSSPS